MSCGAGHTLLSDDHISLSLRLTPLQVPLPSTVPLLFRIDSPIKSSQQVLMGFLHGRLVGEGNVIKHLQVSRG